MIHRKNYACNACRSSGAILPEMATSDLPILVEGSADTLNNQPLIVEVPTQPSPVATTPQDLLVGSPPVINDPLMTPQCSSNPSPVLSSPANNMQVACVDEAQVTSPSHITRSDCLLLSYSICFIKIFAVDTLFILWLFTFIHI